jgi:hypothetical protein
MENHADDVRVSTTEKAAAVYDKKVHTAIKQLHQQSVRTFPDLNPAEKLASLEEDR